VPKEIVLRETDERVKRAEAEIDAFFEGSLPIRGLWRPVVIDALLESAELIATGNPQAGRKHLDAMILLYLNLTIGVSTSLRAAHRVCSDKKAAPPDNLGSLVTDCLALAMTYNTMEDAFYGYWKEYANASFTGEHSLDFTPTGGELDARLRRFSSTDELEISNDVIWNDPLLPPHPVAMAFADSLMKNSELKQQGGFTYRIDLEIIKDVLTAHYDFISAKLGKLPEINLGKFLFSDLLKGWSLVRAVSQIHQVVGILLSEKPGDFATSINWPALYREREEWLRWFSLVPSGEAVMDTLVFDPVEKTADIAITPIVSMGESMFGVVPTLVRFSNLRRNIFVLLANKFGRAYSTYTASKEAQLLGSFEAAFPEHTIGTTIELPVHQGKQLPDIDLLLRSENPSTIVVAEIKWQLSASSTKEVVSRNEYLKKGQTQLLRIRQFLNENPGYLKRRGLINFETTDGNTKYLLLSKGHLGCEDILTKELLLADYDVFVQYLRQFGFHVAIQRLAVFDYLPVQGKDFLLSTDVTKFGTWRVSWNKFHAPELPPDTETEALEDLYRRSAKYCG
jgi:hypothetical protein